jgi:hypothetical protein
MRWVVTILIRFMRHLEARTGMPDEPGWQAIAAGNLDDAEAFAERMLAHAAEERDDGWPADDQRHMAHTLLGFVRLRRGDLDGAEEELIQSAEVSPTPVLRSFGPDLSLAWELLLAGRGEAVVTFAQRFGRFWYGPSRHAQSRE